MPSTICGLIKLVLRDFRKFLNPLKRLLNAVLIEFREYLFRTQDSFVFYRSFREAIAVMMPEDHEECEIVFNCFQRVCDEITKEGMGENDLEIIRYGCEKLGFPAGSPGERVYKAFLLGIYAGIRLSCDADYAPIGDTK